MHDKNVQAKYFINKGRNGFVNCVRYFAFGPSQEYFLQRNMKPCNRWRKRAPEKIQVH